MSNARIHKSYIPGIRGTDRYTLYLEGEYVPLLSIDETADAMRISSKTVRRMIDAGRLSYVRIGRRMLLRTMDIDAYIRARLESKRLS